MDKVYQWLTIMDYGSITQQSVINHIHAYAFQNRRVAQDANNLFKCLEASLTEDALNTLYAEKEIYTLWHRDVLTAPHSGNDEERIRDGILFLWLIINHTTAKTNATISVIIEQLTNLPSLMTEVNSDINAFNTNVLSLVNSYYSNKRESYDNEQNSVHTNNAMKSNLSNTLNVRKRITKMEPLSAQLMNY